MSPTRIEPATYRHVSKHFFIVPTTDAHNYKIIGMLKTIKIPTIAIVEILIVFNIPMIL